MCWKKNDKLLQTTKKNTIQNINTDTTLYFALHFLFNMYSVSKTLQQ